MVPSTLLFGIHKQKSDWHTNAIPDHFLRDLEKNRLPSYGASVRLQMIGWPQPVFFSLTDDGIGNKGVRMNVKAWMGISAEASFRKANSEMGYC